MDKQKPLAPGPSPLGAALLATGDGIGCHHRLRVEVGLGVETLAALELVKPIRQRIPTCAEHACPLRDGCRFAPIFAAGLAGRSGKKYRLTPLGEAALRDPVILRQLGAATWELPLARRIIAALQAAATPLTIFALNTALLDQSLAALATEGNPGEWAFGRGELAGLLNLLSASGAISYDGYLVTFMVESASSAA
ncbi:MAG TPA: hypothetical protein VIL85_11495 [Thermomicrobiales bacterium]|jgi:hypothetical protein